MHANIETLAFGAVADGGPSGTRPVRPGIEEADDLAPSIGLGVSILLGCLSWAVFSVALW